MRARLLARHQRHHELATPARSSRESPHDASGMRRINIRFIRRHRRQRQGGIAEVLLKPGLPVQWLGPKATR